MSRDLLRVGALSFALLSGGCYSITIVNGKEPAPAPILDDKWRSAAAVDLVPIDTPMDMEVVCKETGWAKIRQVHTVVDWFADTFLAGRAIYESTHVDLYCALGSGKPAAPAAPGTPTAPPQAPTGTPNQPPPMPPSQPPKPGDRSL